MGVKQTIRRLLYGNTPGDQLDDTPVELPAGHHRLPSAAAEIQEQIAIQIALKQAREDGPLQTIAEIEAELQDLENDVIETDYPEFDYIELGDHYEAQAEFPPEATKEPAPPLEEGVPQNRDPEAGES